MSIMQLLLLMHHALACIVGAWDKSTIDLKLLPSLLPHHLFCHMQEVIKSCLNPQTHHTIERVSAKLKLFKLITEHGMNNMKSSQPSNQSPSYNDNWDNGLHHFKPDTQAVVSGRAILHRPSKMINTSPPLNYVAFQSAYLPLHRVGAELNIFKTCP